MGHAALYVLSNAILLVGFYDVPDPPSLDYVL